MEVTDRKFWENRSVSDQSFKFREIKILNQNEEEIPSLQLPAVALLLCSPLVNSRKPTQVFHFLTTLNLNLNWLKQDWNLWVYRLIWLTLSGLRACGKDLSQQIEQNCLSDTFDWNKIYIFIISSNLDSSSSLQRWIS